MWGNRLITIGICAAIVGCTPFHSLQEEKGNGGLGEEVDVSAPIVNLSAPTGGASVSGTVMVSFGAVDDVGVVNIQIYIDGVLQGSYNGVSSYNHTWNTTLFPDGNHSLRAEARDAAGNIGTSATVTVTVANGGSGGGGGGGGGGDMTAPTVSLTSPASGTTVSGTIQVSASASDNVGVVGVQFYVDGTATGAEDGTAPYEVALNTAGIANGTHNLTARARDAAGNSAMSAAVLITTQNTVPPPAGNCSAYSDVVRFSVAWGDYKRYTTFPMGGFNNERVFVMSFTVPAAPASYGTAGYTAVSEYQGPPAFRSFSLSKYECDFRNPDPTGVNGPFDHTTGTAPLIRFNVGAPPFYLVPGQTYYLNFKNGYPGHVACPQASCDAGISVLWPLNN